MVLDADRAAQAIVAGWTLFGTVLPSARAHREGDAVGVVTGSPVAALNGVWTAAVRPDESVVGSLLDEVAAAGVPYSLQLRAGADAECRRLIAAHGMQSEVELPLMVLGQRAAERGNPYLSVRRLGPNESALYLDIVAAGFEAPSFVFEKMVTRELLASESIRCFVGEIDGRVVTTGMSVVTEYGVGLFNIATPPDMRGRGYAFSLTCDMIEDAGRLGATDGVWLQSSPPAVSLYERLGFSAVDTWQVWTVPQSGE